jgi:GT2 family glycosyltransferase
VSRSTSRRLDDRQSRALYPVPDLTSARSVVVIVLNWNRWETTADCIDAVLKLSYEDCSLVVVDNGSTDGSVAALRARYPRLRILETGENLGFAGGMNFALRRLSPGEKPDYVWLLNNDTRPAAEALTALVGLCEREPNVGAVGSVLVGAGEPQSVQTWGGGRVSFWTGLPHHHQQQVRGSELDYVVGASLCLRWRAACELGFLDDRYFLYWEDTDLSFRLRAAGWELAVAEDSVVHHQGNGSLAFRSPGWDREFTASSVLFFRRHARLPWAPILVSAGGRILRRAVGGQWANAAATWQGLRKGLVAS